MNVASRRSPQRWHAFLPAGIFVLGIVCTLVAAFESDRILHVRERERFENQVMRVRDRVAERVDDYVAMMEATASLVTAEPDLTRARFEDFLKGLQLPRRYPGVTFMGYSRHVDGSGQADLIAETIARGEGDFHLWPEKPAAEAARDGIDAIAYVFPHNANTKGAIGYDMRSERTRAEAMERARTTGQPAASAQIALLSRTDDKPLGFIIYLAVRSGNDLAGYVFSSYRTSNLFQAVVARELTRELEISAYDGAPSPQNLLFRSPGVDPERESTLDTTIPLAVGGRTWTLRFSASDRYPYRVDPVILPLVLAGGILMTAFLTLASLFQARAAASAERSRGEIAAVNASLETRVAQRTRDLERTQALLRENNENLEETIAARTANLRARNEEIREFVHVVSHDLRAPLVNILGFVGELERVERERTDALRLDPDAMADPQLAADGAEAIGFIRTSADKLQRLTRAVLKLSRDGRRQLRAEPIAMADLIRGIASGLQFQCDEQGATIIVGDLPNLSSDPMAVEQVFANLLENAVKYLSPDRPGRISVNGRVEGRRLVYEVADNGRGIAPADHTRVFELFRRAASDQPGEGLGLASVRMLTRQLGAEITLASELGQGAVFRLDFPRRWVPPDED